MKPGSKLAWKLLRTKMPNQSQASVQNRTMKHLKSAVTSGWLYTGIRVVLALTIAFLLNEFPFYTIESFSYDMRVRLKPVPRPTGQIALVSIDKSTHATMNREPDIVDHRELLKIIERDRPRAIVYLFPPNQLRGTDPDIKKFLETAET